MNKNYYIAKKLFDNIGLKKYDGQGHTRKFQNTHGIYSI